MLPPSADHGVKIKASNMFGRIWEHEPEAFRQALVGRPMLPHAVVESWVANMTTWVQSVMQHLERLPGGDDGAAAAPTLAVYHTSAMPDLECWRTCRNVSAEVVCRTGLTKHVPLGHRSFIWQLNMAGLGVAEELGIPAVDFDQMTNMFERKDFLMDEHHPDFPFLLELFNVLLNLYDQCMKYE